MYEWPPAVTFKPQGPEGPWSGRGDAASLITRWMESSEGNCKPALTPTARRPVTIYQSDKTPHASHWLSHQLNMSHA